ncbi:MAG: beta-lactamase family protein, partial [Spirochaetia bacterium]|nr:beta-lactamase family protein [Spirochaetia bacterium]
MRGPWKTKAILLAVPIVAFFVWPARPWPNKSYGRDLLIQIPAKLTPAQKAELERVKDNLDGWITSSSKSGLVPSTGVIISVKGQTVYSKFQNMGPHTPLWIASSTKPLTSFAIFRLHHLGLVDLDAPASSYVSGLKIENPSLRGGPVTVRALLQQTSGIPYNGRSPLVNACTEGPGCFIPKQIYPSELHYEYSNANYEILALVIEKVTGKPYEEAMRELLFGPLGMHDAKAPGFARGASNIVASADDLSKFAQAMVNSINRMDDEFVGPLAIHKFLDIPSYYPKVGENETLFYYGAGWWGLRRGDRYLCFYHTGIWAGAYSEIAIFPEHQAYMIHLANPRDLRGAGVESYRRAIGNLGRQIVSVATASPIRLDQLNPSPANGDRIKKY